MEIGISRVAAAVEAVVVNFIAYLPELEAERARMLDAEEVQAIVSGQRRLPADRGPISDSLPILACRVFAECMRVGGISIGVSHPCRRLHRFAASCAVGVSPIIDNDHRLAQHLGHLREAGEVAFRREIGPLRARKSGRGLRRPMIEIGHAVIARESRRSDAHGTQVRGSRFVE